MLQFCPLCRKSGNEKKIKAVQINYEEAIWLCESETCTWPFGYEEFTFVAQKANFLDGSNFNSEVQESKELKPTLPMFTELSLYTPPVTPIGDSYTFTTGNSSSSQCKLIPNIQIKKENGKDNTQEKNHTSLVTPGTFDIDTQTSGVKKLNNPQNQEIKFFRNDIKNYNEIKTESLANYTKNENLSQKRPHIRSIEVTNVNVMEVKSENDFNNKSSIKMMNKELKERKPLKSNNASTLKSEVEPKKPVLEENNINSKYLRKQLIEDHNYSQLNFEEVTYNSHEINNTKEEKINDLSETLKNKSNDVQSKPIAQNTECSSAENLNLDNILDDMLSNDLNSTENIDDEWLTSFFL